MGPDRIEKSILLSAPVSRVWQALTDSSQFGAWFGVRLTAPFKPGEESSGPVTTPGIEHLTWRAVIQDVEPEQYFAFTWHPFSIDPDRDYSEEVPTLVEFRLAPAPGGTQLTVTEAGFRDLPDDRLQAAYDAHDKGWAQQLSNLQAFLARRP